MERRFSRPWASVTLSTAGSKHLLQICFSTSTDLQISRTASPAWSTRAAANTWVTNVHLKTFNKMAVPCHKMVARIKPKCDSCTSAPPPSHDNQFTAPTEGNPVRGSSKSHTLPATTEICSMTLDSHKWCSRLSPLLCPPHPTPHELLHIRHVQLLSVQAQFAFITSKFHLIQCTEVRGSFLSYPTSTH